MLINSRPTLPNGLTLMMMDLVTIKMETHRMPSLLMEHNGWTKTVMDTEIIKMETILINSLVILHNGLILMAMVMAIMQLEIALIYVQTHRLETALT